MSKDELALLAATYIHIARMLREINKEIAERKEGEPETTKE